MVYFFWCFTRNGSVNQRPKGSYSWNVAVGHDEKYKINEYQCFIGLMCPIKV